MSVPIEDLKGQLLLSIPEAMRVSGLGRDTIRRLIKDKEIGHFYEGTRLKVVTQSLIMYVRRKAGSE